MSYKVFGFSKRVGAGMAWGDVDSDRTKDSVRRGGEREADTGTEGREGRG